MKQQARQQRIAAAARLAPDGAAGGASSGNSGTSSLWDGGGGSSMGRDGSDGGEGAGALGAGALGAAPGPRSLASMEEYRRDVDAAAALYDAGAARLALLARQARLARPWQRAVREAANAASWDLDTRVRVRGRTQLQPGRQRPPRLPEKGNWGSLEPWHGQRVDSCMPRNTCLLARLVLRQRPALGPATPCAQVGAALLSLMVENSPVPQPPGLAAGSTAGRGGSRRAGGRSAETPAFAYTYRRLEGGVKHQAFVEATPALVGGQQGWVGGELCLAA